LCVLHHEQSQPRGLPQLAFASRHHQNSYTILPVEFSLKIKFS
jgi:hypothetical protein